MLLHPDKAAPEHRQAAETQFRNLQRAFEVLLDPEKRAVYDALGEEGLKSEWRVGLKGKSPEQVNAPAIGSERTGLTYFPISPLYTSSYETTMLLLWQSGQKRLRTVFLCRL